jgi:outer membrane autotransporter protein
MGDTAEVAIRGRSRLRAHPAVEVLGRGLALTALMPKRRGGASEDRAGSLRRRLAILLGGTAAVALSIAQPANAIVINDQTAAAAGGIAGYYDQSNQFPYVVSLFSGSGSGCTGSLINSRTILTAAHCFSPNSVPTISFAPIAGPGFAITSFVRHPNFVPGDGPSLDNDIAVISLAQPVTNVTPVRLLSLQPGQPGFPTVGTTITMVGYGLQGTGSSQVAVAWHPSPGTNNPAPFDTTTADSRRRVATSSLGLDGRLPYAPDVVQSFFISQFRNPLSPENPNSFNLQVGTTPLEGGTASGDSGGPLFAMVNGQMTQIGVVRGGLGQITYYCPGLGGVDDPVVCVDQNNPPNQTGYIERFGYGEFSDWTPIDLFLQWINENNPRRQVTAAPGTFNWSNPAAWIDAFPDPARPNGAVPDNTRGGADINANQAARYYGVTLSNPGTITLDMNPQIDALSILGAQSQLVIGGAYTLQVLLNTTLSAGILTMLPGGTLATGTYTQTGGLLQFQLAPGGANGKITVTSTATLGGSLGVAVTPGLYGLSTPYTLLTAGAISGQFAQFIASPLSSFLSLSGPIYSPTSVGVTLTRTPFGAVPGLNANQQAVGNALEGAYNTTLTGAAAALYTSLLMTGTPNALTLLSGEAASGAQQGAFQLTNQFLGIMLDPFVDGRGNPIGGGAIGFTPERENLPDDIALAYAKLLKASPAPSLPSPASGRGLGWGQRWSVWGAGYGGSNRTAGDTIVAGSHDLAASTAGGTAGLDYRLAPGTVVGFALAGGGTNWSLAQGLGGGKSDAFQAGVYGTARSGPAYLATALAFTNHWMSTDRLAFAGDHLTASFNAQSFGGRVESGYRFMTYYGGLTPYAAIQSQAFHAPGYTETDLNGGGFALGFNSRNATDTRSELGGRFDRLLLLNPEAALTLRARVAWAHDWISDPTLAAVFQTLPGASFIVNGATPAKNSALTSAGAELRLANGVTLLGKFDGEFASHSSTYAGTGTVRLTW